VGVVASFDNAGSNADAAGRAPHRRGRQPAAAGEAVAPPPVRKRAPWCRGDINRVLAAWQTR
jgi:hypothetical protein